MTLIVGAQFQGKLDFAMQLTSLTPQYVADGATCSFEELWEKPIVNSFHLLVKRIVEEELSLSDELAKLVENNPEIIVIADEIAYGYTEDNDQIIWRRKAGDACRQLAKTADEIYHVVCGIPVRIL